MFLTNEDTIQYISKNFNLKIEDAKPIFNALTTSYYFDMYETDFFGELLQDLSVKYNTSYGDFGNINKFILISSLYINNHEVLHMDREKARNELIEVHEYMEELDESEDYEIIEDCKKYIKELKLILLSDEEKAKIYTFVLEEMNAQECEQFEGVEHQIKLDCIKHKSIKLKIFGDE